MKSAINLLCVLDGMNHPPKTGGDQAIFNALRIIQNEVNLHLVVICGNMHNINKDALKYDLNRTKISFYDIQHKNTYELINAICNAIRRKIQSLAGQNECVSEREGVLDTNLERYANAFDFINNYIITNNIQIVQFEFARALYWGQAIYAPVKKVFVQHEIQYVVKKQRFHGRSISNIEKIRYQIERCKELEAMNGYDAIITLSEDDKCRLTNDGIRTKIFPSFAKVQYRQGKLSTFQHNNNIDLIFVGPESHQPNHQGMTWFMENVWNKLHLKYPKICVHIVGNWTTKTKEKWDAQYPNVVFEGFVDNLSKTLQDRILIVPIFEGSGIRMKILEAVNIKSPFVSTTIGAEGLGFISGQNCLIADNAKDFCNAIDKLLTSKEYLMKIALNGFLYAREAFSDERFLSTRINAYQEILNE